jgi:hypothetical protein
MALWASGAALEPCHCQEGGINLGQGWVTSNGLVISPKTWFVPLERLDLLGPAAVLERIYS